MKKLGEVTTELQTVAHEGLADTPVFIERLDGVYKVGDIIVREKDGQKWCVIEARGLDEGCRD